MTFTGLIGTIRFRMSGLTFKPNNGFTGTATLQIVVDDQGHNGAGGAKTTTALITIEVLAGGDEGRNYDLPVEALNPMTTVADVTQIVVRLPDNVIGAPRDLRVTVRLRGPSSNEAFIKIE